MDERHVTNRYLAMPLDELRMRKAQVAKEQSEGRLSRGKRTYRRRIKKALETREGQQDQAKLTRTQNEGTVRLNRTQRYDKGYDAGRRDALQQLHTRRAFMITDDTERMGYYDGYRSVSGQPERY
ncbi:MAG: hypothetical protein PHS73_02645 [Candidatus Peribacteraceae bacterium]|nr:hypothetical protein [Candidatus Peribacteraceae bacterium]